MLADCEIEQRLRLPDDHPNRLRINPYSLPVKVPGKVSHGRTSYGFDVCLGSAYWVFRSQVRSAMEGLRWHEPWRVCAGTTCRP